MCASRLAELTGKARWDRRIAHLRHELEVSAFRAKMVVDYNWLEVVLASQLDVIDGSVPEAPVHPEELAGLYFAQTVLHAHARLTPIGRGQLEGRLHDSLQSDNGFAPLYLEMDVSRRLLNAGYDVEFADLDRRGQYDLHFRKSNIEGEVECKSLSVDAGRKIHRTRSRDRRVIA
jgi:hypothetical protein